MIKPIFAINNTNCHKEKLFINLKKLKNKYYIYVHIPHN